MAPLSLHARIHHDIQSSILSGELKPGDRIPSEAELMALYGCARMTVSKALSALSTAGLLNRRKRAGTFVAQPRAVSMVLDVPDLAAELTGRGQTYSFRLLRREVQDGVQQAHISRQMTDAGAVLLVEGIHVADGVPLAFEERLVSLSAVPDIAAQDFSVEPPGTWLLKHIPWTEAENRIGAVGANAAQARALDIRPGAPCLSIERHTWRGADTVTFVRQVYVAGAYEMVARFGPTRSGPDQTPP